jgi:hypothetical protein
MAVPLFDTRAPLAPLRERLDAAIAAVLDELDRWADGRRAAARH